MATGCLSAPNWPAIEGYDRFDGPVYHTATWPHDPVDFRNKKVAVIGTGSSGIQSIPLIAEQADQLTVFRGKKALCRFLRRLSKHFSTGCE